MARACNSTRAGRPEKLATALPAKNTLVILGLPGLANDQYQDCQEADSSSLASVQSAWSGGGRSASCNACPSHTGRQE